MGRKESIKQRNKTIYNRVTQYMTANYTVQVHNVLVIDRQLNKGLAISEAHICTFNDKVYNV